MSEPTEFRSSATGRFLTRDPVRDGRNWYAYCATDPVNAADPEGLAPHDYGYVENLSNSWIIVEGDYIPGQFGAPGFGRPNSTWVWVRPVIALHLGWMQMDGCPAMETSARSVDSMSSLPFFPTTRLPSSVASVANTFHSPI